MADVSVRVVEGRHTVQGYGDGRIRIGGQAHEGPLILFPEGIAPWPLATACGSQLDGGQLDGSALTVESFAPVFDHQPAVDVLLIGCGARTAMVPPALREALRARGIGVDAMATGAACRTFNLLVVEDRRVAAAVVPV